LLNRLQPTNEVHKPWDAGLNKPVFDVPFLLKGSGLLIPSTYMGGTQMDILQQIGRDQIRTDFPDYRVGDTVKVHYKLRKAEKNVFRFFRVW
jgi:hypothetical protein